MGTRPGAIDPGVVLHLFQGLGLSAKEVETMLYKKSGLLGISGISNDMRDLLGSREPAARLAVDYFVYRAAKEIGALAAVLGGIDGLVFTAGIGEHSAEIRRRICEASAWLGVELDPTANARARTADLQNGKPRLGLGDPDQRRTDDRPAHRRCCWDSSKPAPSGQECRGVMATIAPHAQSKGEPTSPWAGFRTGLWQKEINVRDFIQQNYEPYDGDASFLAGATRRTQGIWDALNTLFVEERKKGVLDVSQIPQLHHSPCARLHRPRAGNHRGPANRGAAQARDHAQWRLSPRRDSAQDLRYEPDPHVVEAFTKYRKTHNDAVFDAYTADVRRCRSSHILTGLPDAYGRGRIIGDYRRVALYGVNRLIERKKEEKSDLDARQSSDDVIRDREELAEQIRALGELRQMAASYGFDISKPAGTAREAVQWLYFGYLAGVKEQNGAAMSLGRTSTFLDIYFERDLASGALTEEQAQEIVDDFVIKLRIIRFFCARLNMTTSSPATPRGSPNRSRGWATTANRWSRKRASASCRRSTTWVRRLSRI